MFTQCILSRAALAMLALVDVALMMVPGLFVRLFRFGGFAYVIGNDPECKLIRPAAAYAGKQGFSYVEGISADHRLGGIAMMLLTCRPAAAPRRICTRRRDGHLRASGEATTYWGAKLENATVTRAGDMFYIPAGVPHLPVNTGTSRARRSSRGQTRVSRRAWLLPELDGVFQGKFELAVLPANLASAN